MSTLSSLTVSLELTPLRQSRKKRPSWSPLKQPEPATPTARRAANESPEKSTKEGDVEVGLDGANLVFKEFSFAQEDGSFANIDLPHAQALRNYLHNKFGVRGFMNSGMFIFLECDGEIPPSDKRPFTIAGCIGVWIAAGDPYPWELIGPGPANGDDLELPEHLASDLRAYQLPKLETLKELWQDFFPDALQLQYFTTGIIVELPKVSDLEHDERMEHLPGHFGNAEASLSFVNGLRKLTQLARMIRPQPRFLSGEADDTDYMSEVGFASPGVLISSTTGQQISAGILVEKEGVRRLTVAIHCWDEELDTVPEKLGDPKLFTLTQGKTPIGHVVERIGTTDIGLAALEKGVTFSNRFLDISATAKSLLRYRNIRVNDEFTIDSFVTGIQRLCCVGAIIREGDTREKHFVQKRNEKGEPVKLPGEGGKVVLMQGIYATSAPEIHRAPRSRAGACGAALLRTRLGQTLRPIGDEVVSKGEIGGFMLWADLQRRGDTSSELVCVSDCLDELIDAGWTVVPTAEKSELLEEEFAEDGVEARGHSPKKVQK